MTGYRFVIIAFVLLSVTSTVKAQNDICNSVTEVPPIECHSLIALYERTQAVGWMTNISPCSWPGIACKDGHVTHIDLIGLNLNGTLPPELGNFSKLDHLTLAGTNDPNKTTSHGNIPPELGKLTNLQSLALYGPFSGNIPSELGNLVKLRYLFLSGNNLQGSIPPELGNLKKLKILELSDNRLTGVIPAELGKLAKVRNINLSFNQLSGPIPAELGNLANLDALNLYYNHLDGGIPSELGDLPKLQYLDLSFNELSGSIPPELGNLANLATLNLSYNHLTGSIPSQLGHLTNLGVLYLSANRLSGNIPTSIGDLTSLQTLLLESNRLSGEVPASITELHVNWIGLDYNKLISTNPKVQSFFKEKVDTGFGWAVTQTMPPTQLSGRFVSKNTIELTWIPITYTEHEGFYEIGYSATPGGPYITHGKTQDKTISKYLITDLSPQKSYYFVIRSFTPAHLKLPEFSEYEHYWRPQHLQIAADSQQNSLWSDWSKEITIK